MTAFFGKLAVAADLFVFYGLLHILQFFPGTLKSIMIFHSSFVFLVSDHNCQIDEIEQPSDDA